jgi:hypothetical protein
MSFRRHTNDLILSSRVCFMEHFHLLSFSMSIIILKVSISCKDIFYLYKKKLLIL